MMCEIMSEQDWQATSFREILELAPDSGVFINTFTFEVDLFKEPDAAGQFLTAVKGLTDNNAMHKRFAALADDPKTLDPTQFLKDIDSIGKGRVAQRLAAVLLDTPTRAPAAATDRPARRARQNSRTHTLGVAGRPIPHHPC